MRRRSRSDRALRTSSPSTRDAAAVGLDQPVGQPQQRGLARAGAADDGEEFALGDLERDVVDRHHALARGRRQSSCRHAHRRSVAWSASCRWRLSHSDPPGEAKPSVTYHVAALALNYLREAAKASFNRLSGKRVHGGLRQSQRRSRLKTRRWRFVWPMRASIPRSRRPGCPSSMASSSPSSGPTGCGKSTLLNVAAGLLRPAVGIGQDLRPAACGPEPGRRLSVSGRRAVSLEDRDRQCRHRARDQGRAARSRRCSARRAG